MLVNFVMSTYTESSIFNSFIKYLEKQPFYSIKTVSPVDGANLYYYFRPHLEDHLIQPCIVTVHHDLNEVSSSLNFNLFLPRYLEANLIVCLNTEQVIFLERYGITNTVVIPHGFNSDIFIPRVKIKNKKKVIGFFSHYYPRMVKGECYVMKIAEFLSKDEYSFILVGKKRNLLAITLQQAGFECFVYESLPYTFFGQLYQSIDYLLIASLFEGGPACLPEALASNTPVFSSLVGMLNDYHNHDLVTILDGNAEQDAYKISSYKKNTKYKQSPQLLSWEDVSLAYFQLFISVKSEEGERLSYKDKWRILYSKYNFKMRTLYLKRRVKHIFSTINDSRRFIYLYWVNKY